MNIQALIRQAQSVKKNMTEAKNKIDAMTFLGKSELVEVEMNGKKQVLSVKIKTEDTLDKEDIEILEDMITIAVNDAITKIDKEIKNKLGNGVSGLEGLL